jgi:hypothetical protein
VVICVSHSQNCKWILWVWGSQHHLWLHSERQSFYFQVVVLILKPLICERVWGSCCQGNGEHGVSAPSFTDGSFPLGWTPTVSLIHSINVVTEMHTPDRLLAWACLALQSSLAKVQPSQFTSLWLFIYVSTMHIFPSVFTLLRTFHL